MEQQNQLNEVEIDLKELLGVLLNKIWIIICAGLVGLVAAGMYTAIFVTPQYTSSSMIYILSKSTSLTSLADLQLGSQLKQDYNVLITSRPVLEKVVNNLNLDMTYGQLKGKISVTNPADTRILSMTVTDSDPYAAKTIVDELSNVVVDQVAEIMATDKPNIIEDGNIASAPSTPNMRKNCLMGAMAGIVLSGGIIMLLYLMDDSIKSADDVEKYLGLNVLGSIPIFKEEQKNGNKIKKKKKVIRK